MCSARESRSSLVRPNSPAPSAQFMLVCAMRTGQTLRRRQFIILLGGAAVWPALARAQQPTLPTIGFMSGRSPDDSRHLVAAFHQGLGGPASLLARTSPSNTMGTRSLRSATGVGSRPCEARCRGACGGRRRSFRSCSEASDLDNYDRLRVGR